MPGAARVTDLHNCPLVDGATAHVGGPILSPGEPTVLIEGLPAARVGDMATCTGPSDMIITGSSSVYIGGQYAARIWDTTIHGGMITSGSTTVLIGN